MTHGRARVWSTPATLIQSEWKYHPHSIRAISNYSVLLADLGAIEEAYTVLDQPDHDPAAPGLLRGQARILRSWLDCRVAHDVDPGHVRGLIQSLPPHLDLNTFLTLEVLTNAVIESGCGRLGKKEMADALVLMADSAKFQSDDFNQKWALRNRAAILYAEEGDWSRAVVQARKGWQPSTPGAGAASIIEILLVAGNLEEAEAVYQQASERVAYSANYARELSLIAPLIDKERKEPGWNRRRVMGLPESTDQSTNGD